MSPKNAKTPLALWGGVECTFNRVGDTYFDQLERTGHAHRLEDLDLFAQLGLRAIRYPVLWERTAPEGVAGADWTWADVRLSRLRELSITPIVGLLHHGGGPRHTGLLDPAFPALFAEYAQAFAEHFPWVTHYSPINEPLTTARFSGLYGHWYPHGRDSLTFARCLLAQCRAIQLAMQAIRSVNSQALLIQTEDLGKTYSTPRMAYQAEFEDERRWLTFDLLCGRVDSDHPMWHFLRWLGVNVNELLPFIDAPSPPDIFGIDYYVTGERFLDERLDRYPPWTWGGNGRDRYADVEAVRVCPEGIAGPAALLREAWDRYRCPLALTETHLGSTSDEQIRWFAEVWDEARSLRCEGIDLRAVTAWSLLGSYDWDSLVTRDQGHYEPGVFDVVEDVPRPTPLASLLRGLADTGRCDHPALQASGWWRHPERLLYPPVSRLAGPTAREAALAQ